MQNAKRILFALAVSVLAFAQLGLFGNKDDKAEEKREAIRDMRDELLAELERANKQAARKIRKAEGYACFSNVGVNVILASFAGGRGVVVDNRTGDETFMNMGTVGVGYGIGVKDFRAVFVFWDRKTMEYFVEKGWDFGAQADAAVKADDKGAAAEDAANVMDGVDVYQFTKSGLSIQATLQGTKYWKNDKLND